MRGDGVSLGVNRTTQQKHTVEDYGKKRKKTKFHLVAFQIRAVVSINGAHFKTTYINVSDNGVRPPTYLYVLGMLQNVVRHSPCTPLRFLLWASIKITLPLAILCNRMRPSECEEMSYFIYNVSNYGRKSLWTRSGLSWQDLHECFCMFIYSLIEFLVCALR